MWVSLDLALASNADFLFGQVNTRACISHIVICTHYGFRLWYNLATKGFISEFFF